MTSYFLQEPKISVNLKDIKKPYKLLNNITYIVGNYYIYNIVINKGYSWNGANIPRIFWRIIGSQYNPEFLPASLVHDYLCENKDFIPKDGVKISSDIFRDILIMYGVKPIKAKLMATAVRGWQYLQRGWH